MAGRSLTANCSTALHQCSSQNLCGFDDVRRAFHDNIRGYIWRHDALLLTEEILAMILVGIGSYGQRYRHHPFTRFIFLGATTLFLPIISSVISTVGSFPEYVITSPNYNVELIEDQRAELSALVAICSAFTHSFSIVVWAFLVQIVMINTSTIVSVDDREGQSKAPPYQLLVQGLWTFYLGFSFFRVMGNMMVPVFLRFVPPFALLCSKIVLKYYAFEKARRSYALGRNPGLVYVYMQQLQAQEEADQHVEPPVREEAPPPPLLVMGEDGLQVEKHPLGYAVKGDSGSGPSLITIDRVWHLDNTLLISTPRLKDLCLSFALFKLLRCRFASYKLTNAGCIGTLTFFRSLLLKVSQHDRVFEVIANELCFIHDYYYSSLPISYSKCCLPFLTTILALLCIGYCVLYMIDLIVLWQIEHFSLKGNNQIYCRLWCINQHLVTNQPDASIGRLYYDAVPLFLLLVLVVTAELRDMASYICSNWTKVALICCYVNRASSRYSFCIEKWVSLLLRCRCKVMNHWDEKMSQCSVLIFPPRTSPLVLVRHLLCLPDQRTKIKVPAPVKVCIVSALRSSFNGGLSNGLASLRQSQVGKSFLWACNGKGTSDIILIWHIATCITEVKHPYRHNQEQDSTSVSNSDHKVAATHLSRYCAYLVTWCPELLPDNIAWSKNLYEAVKKDARCALASHHAAIGSSMPEDECKKLIELLSENSKHEVLKNGVKLGKQLMETIDDEETAWKLLADFWSEMILYVAPSDNLKGHSEAIARGGELITLLWAMLFHAGIVSRPGEEDGAASTSAGVV